MGDLIELGFVLFDEVGRGDDDAFFGEVACGRWHGAGGDTADLGMVGSVGDVGDGCLLIVVGEDGSDEGDVGEVGAANGGVVGDDGVAGHHLDLFSYHPDTHAKSAEVDGDVGGAGDEVAVSI